MIRAAEGLYTPALIADLKIFGLKRVRKNYVLDYERNRLIVATS